MANDAAMNHLGALTIAAQKRLEGTICYFEAGCASDDAAAAERARAEAHAALDAVLDAKAASYQAALASLRNPR